MVIVDLTIFAQELFMTRYLQFLVLHALILVAHNVIHTSREGVNLLLSGSITLSSEQITM